MIKLDICILTCGFSWHIAGCHWNELSCCSSCFNLHMPVTSCLQLEDVWNLFFFCYCCYHKINFHMNWWDDLTCCLIAIVVSQGWQQEYASTDIAEDTPHLLVTDWKETAKSRIGSNSKSIYMTLLDKYTNLF